METQLSDPPQAMINSLPSTAYEELVKSVMEDIGADCLFGLNDEV